MKPRASINVWLYGRIPSTGQTVHMSLNLHSVRTVPVYEDDSDALQSEKIIS